MENSVLRYTETLSMGSSLAPRLFGEAATRARRNLLSFAKSEKVNLATKLEDKHRGNH